MPYELLKNPNQQEIREWLEKKLRIFRRIKIAMIVCTPVTIALYYFYRDVHSTVKGLAILDVVTDFIQLVMFPLLALMFYLLERQYRLTDEEISSAVSEFNHQQHRPV